MSALKVFFVIGMALLAQCFIHGRDGHVKTPQGDFCHDLSLEIMSMRWGDSLNVGVLYDIPPGTVVPCADPIVQSFPVKVDYAGLNVFVTGTNPGLIVGWSLFRSGGHEARNLHIVFSEKSTNGPECWNNHTDFDCMKSNGGGTESIRNNGIAVFCDHCLVENVSVKGGPSGGIMAVLSEGSIIRNAEVSGAKYDGVGCNRTKGVLFENIYTHHNIGAGVTIDDEGSCAFDQLRAENNSHAFWARNTHGLSIKNAVFSFNQSGFNFDRSVVGNDATCPTGIFIKNVRVHDNGMSMWIDPDCHKLPDESLIVEHSSFAANTACVPAQILHKFPGLKEACDRHEMSAENESVHSPS